MSLIYNSYVVDEMKSGIKQLNPLEDLRRALTPELDLNTRIAAAEALTEMLGPVSAWQGENLDGVVAALNRGIEDAWDDAEAALRASWLLPCTGMENSARLEIMFAGYNRLLDALNILRRNVEKAEAFVFAA